MKLSILVEGMVASWLGQVHTGLHTSTLYFGGFKHLVQMYTHPCVLHGSIEKVPN